MYVTLRRKFQGFYINYGSEMFTYEISVIKTRSKVIEIKPNRRLISEVLEVVTKSEPQTYKLNFVSNSNAQPCSRKSKFEMFNVACELHLIWIHYFLSKGNRFDS